MRVFKFGGASVKDATAVKNVAKIVQDHAAEELVVIISAMGKTTNALEAIHLQYMEGDPDDTWVQTLRERHFAIIKELFPDRDHLIYKKIEELFVQLNQFLATTSNLLSFEQSYDYVVSFGELISTTIVEAYLSSQDVKSKWIDARTCILTDNTFKEGKIQWDRTCDRMQSLVKPLLHTHVVVSQGFIGATAQGQTTTLGREGSDFSAAIFASCLQAEDVTIWKDVPGVMNADPKRISNTELYEQLPYEEAAEMTYYGASVIHPKTIKPLANRSIPLLVRSFAEPSRNGTVISKASHGKYPAAIIYKMNQVLISFGVKDFTFINEENLSIILHLLSKLNIRINLMQNSAISFSVCTDNHPARIQEITENLKHDFVITKETGLELITVKYVNDHAIEQLLADKTPLLKQQFGDTMQVLVRQQAN